MSDDESADADMAMRQMMGFGNFGSGAKKKSMISMPTATGANSIAQAQRDDLPRRKKAKVSADETLPDAAGNTTVANMEPPIVSPNSYNTASSHPPATLPPRPPPPNAPLDDPTPTYLTAQRTVATSEPPAYTNPVTGISFTQRELNELGQGKRNANAFGDTVYFKPKFLDPDPWAKVREMQSWREPQGGATANGAGYR